LIVARSTALAKDLLLDKNVIRYDRKRDP
jgi:hypothetical protein